MSRLVVKPTMWFPNRSNTNRPVQVQKQARSLKFWIYKVEELYYPCSENKGADISFAVTAKLICVFVFAYADCWFSHEAAQLWEKTCHLVSSRVHTILFPSYTVTIKHSSVNFMLTVIFAFSLKLNSTSKNNLQKYWSRPGKKYILYCKKILKHNFYVSQMPLNVQDRSLILTPYSTGCVSLRYIQM